MRTMNRMTASVAATLLVGAVLVEGLSGQVANASARTLGMGGSTTATARYLEALSVNPAGLGMPGSGFSLALVPVTVRSGLGPVTLADLADQGGQVVSPAVKEAWLQEIANAGVQSGSVGAEVTAFALTLGRVGFQLSTLAGGNMEIGPDIAEAVLYGNAGRSGQPTNLSLAGSTVDGFAVTTASFSAGIPISSENGSMALGATLKYSLGHVMAVGRDQGGSVNSDPIRVNVNFPSVTFDDETSDGIIGSGFGLDLGFQMQRERLHLGAAIQNLFHSFAWDESKLVFRAGTATLQEGSNTTDFESRPYASAPAVLKTAVDDMKFNPVLAVGAAYDVQPDLTLSADVRNRFGDGMSLAPKLHAGVGAEYRGLGVLHLRGGGAVVTDGLQIGGGASLNLGPVSLSFAAAMQKGSKEDTSIGQFTLSFGGR